MRNGSRKVSSWLEADPRDAGAFETWCDTIAPLPRKQTRVRTWALLTVFGLLARPTHHVFFKPQVMRLAARRHGFELEYSSKPSADVYASRLDCAARLRADVPGSGLGGLFVDPAHRHSRRDTGLARVL